MTALFHHVKMINIIQFMVCVVTANVVCLLIIIIDYYYKYNDKFL